MALLEWTDALELGEPAMDATHREYADLLNRLEDATDGQFLARLDEFVAHTERHFGDENERMAATQFPPSHCHAHEHEQVLLIMRDVRGRVANGEVYLGRVLATEMGKWFEHHAATMDKVLAYWLRVSDADRAQLLAESAAAQAHQCAPGGACAVHGEHAEHAEPHALEADVHERA
jgi:hemerythrin-like metal-binding protein